VRLVAALRDVVALLAGDQELSGRIPVASSSKQTTEMSPGTSTGSLNGRYRFLVGAVAMQGSLTARLVY
jgi:hypothetical protein